MLLETRDTTNFFKASNRKGIQQTRNGLSSDIEFNFIEYINNNNVTHRQQRVDLPKRQSPSQLNGSCPDLPLQARVLLLTVRESSRRMFGIYEKRLYTYHAHF